MVDIYLEGAEVHAETPEEEREASLILSAALSGKTIPAGGCICPDQRDSTVGKGITMRFCDGTDMTITPKYDLSLLDQTAIDAYYATNPDKRPAVEMEVGLKSGWANLLLAAYQPRS